MNIGFIPARGGSKGIPKKNLSHIGVRTLLELGIEKLKAIDCQEVYVSTDSSEIMMRAKEFGAKVIQRPDEISGDTATTESSIAHFLSIANVSDDDLIILHQLTSPFLKTTSIRACIDILEKDRQFNSCFTAIERHAFAWEKKPNSHWIPVNHQRISRLRRQELPERVIESGGAYVFRAKEFRSQMTRYAKPSTIVKISFLENFEIDSQSELLEANYINEKLRGSYET